MVGHESFAAAEAYMREQERALPRMPEDAINQFVTGSLMGLAVEHFEPLVHDVGATLPQTEDQGLRIDLINDADNHMVDPSFAETLPARFSREVAGRGRSDGLLLSMDSGLLKIRTSSGGLATARYVGMHITQYGHASRVAAANFREARASFGDIVDPEATILVPRKSVLFDYRPEFEGNDLRREYSNYIKPADNIRASSYNSEPSYEELEALHQAYISEARVALTALKTLLK